MDTNHFENLISTLTTAASRRGMLGGLTSGLLAAWPLLPAFDEAAAKRNRKRKKRGKKKQKNVETPALPPSPPSPPPPPGPVTRADAVCPGPSDNEFFVGGRARLAQTFTALASGPLVSAQVGIAQPSGTVSDYILRLSPVDGSGVPVNDVLAAAFVPNGSVPEGISDVTFVFATPFQVVAGTRYALVLARPGEDNFSWISRSGDACLGQRFGSESQSAPFELFGNGVDHVFTTFVSS